MKQFVLGAVTMLAALLVAALALVWSVGSPGSGADVAVPSSPSAATATPTTPTTPTAPEGLAKGDTWLGDVRLTSSQVVTGDGGLTDVTAVGSGVTLTGDGLAASRLDIDATLPYASAANQIGGGVTLFAAEDGLAGLRRRVSVLGRDVEVRATGVVRAQGGQLVIEPQTIDLDGPDWLDTAASSVVRELVTIRHTIEGVPEGMALTSVSVQAGGFRAHLRGADVTVSP